MSHSRGHTSPRRSPLEVHRAGSQATGPVGRRTSKYVRNRSGRTHVRPVLGRVEPVPLTPGAGLAEDEPL